MWRGLGAIDGVTLFGPPPGQPRTPTVAFAVAGRASEDVARRLARRAVFVSHGDFYAATAIRRIGREADGVVRAGCACYTTTEEVDRLVEAVSLLPRTEHAFLDGEPRKSRTGKIDGSARRRSEVISGGVVYGLDRQELFRVLQ